MDIYQRLNEMKFNLPKAPPKGGIYAPIKEFGNNLVYVSGCGPIIGDESISGKLGAEFTTEQGYEYAKNCMLNVLAILHDNIGDLNLIKNPVKILVLVSGTNEFYDQPQVANGASQLLCDLFGEENGAPSRSAIGVNALPGNIPVEIEAIFEIKA